MGAQTCVEQYQNHYFFNEYLQALDTIIWENNMRFVKACDQIGLYLDVADGYLLIRICGLDQKCKLQTRFWQARRLATKSAKTISDAVLHAFTKAPPHVEESFVLTEQEFFTKLTLGVMDGARENGVQRGGKAVDHAFAGENVLFYLQSKKDTIVPNQQKIQGWWCNSHMLDLVSNAPEKQIAWVAVLLTFMRSLAGHIVASTKAQGILRWLSTIIDDSDADHETKSLASVHYAPQRFLSTVQPLAVICDRLDELVIYLNTVKAEDKKPLVSWADNMLETMEDMRFFLVLPGLLDILTVVNEFNQSTQSRRTRAETVAKQLILTKAKLQDLVLRTDTDAQGLKKATIVEAMIDWLQGKHPSKVAKDATHFEKMCAHLSCTERPCAECASDVLWHYKCNSSC